jgi:uncharacterized protein
MSDIRGTTPLEPMSIQDLKALAEGRQWDLDQHLEGLNSLTPVRGKVQATHRGNRLEVEGVGDTIVTLCCDRCLQHFNHPLHFQSRELLWLDRAGSQQEPETVLSDPGNLVVDLDQDLLEDTLDPRGSFDPGQWAFEQLSLQLPLVNRCGTDCPGPSTWGSDSSDGDPRWAALAALTRTGDSMGAEDPSSFHRQP